MTPSPVTVKFYEAPPVNRRELLLRCGCTAPDAETESFIRQCLSEAHGSFSYRVCFRVLPVRRISGALDLTFAETESADLAESLKDCGKILLFAATVGVGADRLIERYKKVSPAKALIFQAIGAERIESLCDLFCADFAAALPCGERLRPRFSPGYGDLPLSLQEAIFSALDCPRKIGLTLNSSLLMSPSKSVTAIAGIEKSRTDKEITDCRANRLGRKGGNE